MSESQVPRSGVPVAIVTGASRGIGAATATKLANEGYRVMLCARNVAACRSVVDGIRVYGGLVDAIECDIRDYESVQNMIDTALKRWGRIDVLVNNAGIMDPIGKVIDCDPAQWCNNIQTNLIGAFHGCRAALPIFTGQGAGVLINICSGAGSHALLGWSAYCVAKAGVSMLTQCVAKEVLGTAVRVYGFQPGMVNTKLTREAFRSRINRVAELDPQQFDDPSKPAAAIVWLCSAEARELAGRELDIDEVESHLARTRCD